MKEVFYRVNRIAMGFVCESDSEYGSGCPSTDLSHLICNCAYMWYSLVLS